MKDNEVIHQWGWHFTETYNISNFRSNKTNTEILELVEHGEGSTMTWGIPLDDATVEPRSEDAFDVATNFVRKNVAGELYKRVHPDLVVDPRTRKVVLKMRPEDLRAAMWLQFAQAVSGNKEYRQCRHCDTWFELSAADNGRSRGRLFCTDPCKSRDYRRRKDRALALSATGLVPVDVAARLASEGLETDADTVKNWVCKNGK